MTLEREYQRKRIVLELAMAREAQTADDSTTAERHYRQVLILNVANAPACAWLLRLWLEQGLQAECVGRLRIARKCYRKVLALDAQNVMARFKLTVLRSPMVSMRVVGLGVLLALGLLVAILGGCGAPEC